MRLLKNSLERIEAINPKWTYKVHSNGIDFEVVEGNISGSFLKLPADLTFDSKTSRIIYSNGKTLFFYLNTGIF